jgi:EmrB/QacA subfamily drug resistance transporter
MVNRASAGISREVTLVITSIAVFSMPLMMSSVNIALPSIGKELAMEAVLLGWVNTSYLLSTAAFLIPFGRLADIFGRKKIFVFGLFISTISSFLCAVSNSAAMLISFRVLQAIGASMMFGTALAILTSVFPAEERGRAFGINVAAVNLGLSIGPFIGGVLTQYLGWRSIFFLGALLGLISIILAFWKLKGEWAEARGERFDIVGSIAYSLSLTIMMYGFSVLTTPLGIALVFVGLLGMLAFMRWETKTASPVFDLDIFRENIVFVFSNLAAMINHSATFAVTFLLSLYLQYTKGLSPQTAGLILVASPAVLVIFSPIAGRLSDRVEPRKVASSGMAFSCVALLLFVFLSEVTSLGLIVAGLVILGFGMAFFGTPNANAIMGSVGKRFWGVASGTLGTTRTIGMMLSMGIVMILFSIYIGKAQITPEYYPAFLRSTKAAFAICAAICFCGIFAQLAGRKARQG